jgi:hypothetical protein
MTMVSRLLLGVLLRVRESVLCRLFLGTTLVACTAGVNDCSAQLCGQLNGVNFSENFNTLAISGSSNQIPNTFEFNFNENPGNITYAADDGSNSSANTYSYGSMGSTDRALGEITGTVVSTIGACFTNNTNHAITSFIVGYTGEEWHLGVAGGTVDRLDFQYNTSTGATLTTGTYLNVDALDFTTPANSGAGIKDGNAAANRTVFAPVAVTPAAPIQPEQSFYIRWVPSNISGDNDGLAIDDFSIGTTLAPGIAGDYSNNGVVDAGDYLIWRKKLNQSVTIPNDITPGTVVQQDYVEWRNRFGKTTFDFGSGSGTNIPEPATTQLAATLATIVLLRLCGRRSF